MTVPASWEWGPWETKSERCGVCDGDGNDTVGARIAGAESERYGVCDGTDIVGVGAMGGRVRCLFRKKII